TILGRCRVAKKVRSFARPRAADQNPQLWKPLSYDLFLRSRISANTFQAGLPASPTVLATSGRFARKNGFAAFSARMVDGIVGSPGARSFSPSVPRALSAALPVSTVFAKRILALVYSCPQ